MNFSDVVHGSLTVSVNLINYNNPISESLAFVSKGPAATGRYIPWPDPAIPSTYKWTTSNGFNTPFPGFTIKDATTSSYYMILYCANAPCEYNINANFVEASASINTTNFPSETPKVPASYWKGKDLDQANQIRKRFYVRNAMQINGVVNYQQWAPLIEIPICKNTLMGIYGRNAAVTLSSIVVGQKLSDLFYQQFSTIPVLSEFVPKWSTPPPNVDEPILDRSGESKLPVNHFVSLPVKIQNLPERLYHGIVGQGGQGGNPPYPNQYNVIYEWLLSQ